MTNQPRSFARMASTALWGNSVALSWVWGLGLFFSVQFTVDFGLKGLLTFLAFNCSGLFLFGLITNQIAKRGKGSESLANFFSQWSRPFRLGFFLYQLLAITLTIFALIRYAWQPLGFQPGYVYLPLIVLVILATSILFGEEFNIRKIKYSHGVLFLLLAASISIIFSYVGGTYFKDLHFPARLATNDLNYYGYIIPICIGFLLGPWLDLQQWQRAIEIRRENLSITSAYAFGAILFGAILLFHGILALWALSGGAGHFTHFGFAGYAYSEGIITHLLATTAAKTPWLFGAYLAFLSLCVLTTLDSGYIALRWFLKSNANRSSHPIFSLIPSWFLTSPILPFIFCGIIAIVTTALDLELEYFMVFYATFFVGYEALAIGHAFMNGPLNIIPQVKMFCIGSLAIVVFAGGYFLHQPIFQILGSLMPLGYVFWLMVKPMSGEDFTSGTDDLTQQPPTQEAAPPLSSSTEMSAALTSSDLAHSVTGHFEGKWFVHTFVATYADTNSVGNVYFGMYAMWVGKTRELFFNQVMPKFNLKETPYYILTRSFDHKFVRETREFEIVSVRIRVASYNRKFVTLEHEIHDSEGHLLGKGSQGLLFVSSTDYKMLDIPQDVVTAFIAHT